MNYRRKAMQLKLLQHTGLVGFHGGAGGAGFFCHYYRPQRTKQLRSSALRHVFLPLVPYCRFAFPFLLFCFQNKIKCRALLRGALFFVGHGKLLMPCIPRSGFAAMESSRKMGSFFSYRKPPPPGTKPSEHLTYQSFFHWTEEYGLLFHPYVAGR